MSLLIQPMFETNALEPSPHISNRICEATNIFTSESARTSAFIEPNAHKLNGIYERTNLFITDSVRPSAFTDIRALNSTRLSTNFWENSNTSSQIAKPLYENEFAKANACKNLWTCHAIPRPVMDPPSLSCKSKELWRPFSSPTRNEAFRNSFALESQKSSSNLPVITPSTVKIGPSKTSVFQPVKKKKKFTCLNCSSAFSSGVQLKSHLRKHKALQVRVSELPENLRQERRAHSPSSNPQRIQALPLPHLRKVLLQEGSSEQAFEDSSADIREENLRLLCSGLRTQPKSSNQHQKYQRVEGCFSLGQRFAVLLVTNGYLPLPHLNSAVATPPARYRRRGL
ncbi:unnamed protein product [Larinioides sclopetarius]|uniref:C2H2-type domain-containing protein n=1 Tax=Larinioides sclopetarius TaxID=280406 RepID=A0AAV2B792_9ARAC